MGTTGKIPVLLGISGFVEGERIIVARDADVTIGRSRGCVISLRRAAKYLEADAATRDEDHDFNTVSRTHTTVHVNGDTVTVSDNSTNGTWCNGDLIRDPRTVDLTQGGCVIRLGTRESFDLQLLDAEDERLRGLVPVGTA